MAQRLDDPEIATRLAGIPAWQREGGEIARIFTFRDFAGAISFVNRVAALAEAVDHHPDIDIRWNRVTLRLSTHSRGGLTSLDFELAARIDAL